MVALSPDSCTRGPNAWKPDGIGRHTCQGHPSQRRVNGGQKVATGRQLGGIRRSGAGRHRRHGRTVADGRWPQEVMT